MKIAIVGVGRQRPDRRLRPAPGRPPGRPCSSAIATPGGHVATVTVDTPAGPVPVDTGFIVYNERTYPRFVGLLAELGVETQPSDMSFGSACHACGVEFSSRGARGFFAQRSLAARPVALADVRRHRPLLPRRPGDPRRARAPTRRPSASASTSARYGRGVPRPLPGPDHVGRLVHGARTGSSSSRSTTCSASSTTTASSASATRAQWRTVTGGSRAYVDRLVGAAARRDASAPGDPVVGVTRDDGRRHRPDGERRAASASTPWSWRPTPTTRCAALGDADAGERAALGGFEYNRNQVVLHTDERVLPRRPRRLGVVERRTGGLPPARRRASR